MSTGSGDEYAIVFAPAGAYIRGFDHESLMSPYASVKPKPRPWPGVLDDVPEAFRTYVEEPAFADADGTPFVTACLWRTTEDTSWRTGGIDFPDAPDPDGSGFLFELLTDRSSEAYQEFAVSVREVPVDLDAVRHVLSLRPLTDELVALLAPGLTLSGLGGDIAAIDCPAGPLKRRSPAPRQGAGLRKGRGAGGLRAPPPCAARRRGRCAPR
ncbi:hypothetical protein [Streptomyces gobitricini]|uniref:Uncharacterized protein n=1 Tax=Streptomyces gobitricini TaxID=68211 RepID=A0ABP6AA96_9ACTN